MDSPVKLYIINATDSELQEFINKRTEEWIGQFVDILNKANQVIINLVNNELSGDERVKEAIQMGLEYNTRKVREMLRDTITAPQILKNSFITRPSNN